MQAMTNPNVVGEISDARWFPVGWFDEEDLIEEEQLVRAAGKPAADANAAEKRCRVRLCRDEIGEQW